MSKNGKKNTKEKNIKNNETNKKEGSIIYFVICIIILCLGIICLPKLNKLFWKSSEPVNEVGTEEQSIPTKYNCSYGPLYDEFYDYYRSEEVVFSFDKEGNLNHINSLSVYQAINLELYNQMLTKLNLDSNHVTYDKENYIVRLKITTDNITDLSYPSTYDKLKTYLSTNNYTCTQET